MAIDSTLFCADIPAGTYAVGDTVNLVCTDGPANVRSGRGSAKLKTIMTGNIGTASLIWKIHVKNSDWIDEVQNLAVGMQGSVTAFDDESGGSQGGHDCNLTQNSGWMVYAECMAAGTITAANSLFCLIDVDYPEVGGVTNPRAAVGLPTSISYNKTITTNVLGAALTATWASESVDYFKAGYRYVLDAVESMMPNSSAVGFIAFSNAAGMGGLTRIIPINNQIDAIRYPVRYSSVLVKGPMDVKLKIFEATAKVVTVNTVHDYVKQKA